MHGAQRELFPNRGEVAEATLRLRPSLGRAHPESLELLGARGEMGRDLLIELAIELIAPERRMPEEPTESAAHTRVAVMQVCAIRA